MTHRIVHYMGVDISVDYGYYPPSIGARERGSGVQLEPDEPAMVEVYEIKIGPQEVTDVFQPHMDGLEELLLELEQETPDEGF